VTRWLLTLLAIATVAVVTSHISRERRAQDRAIVEDRWDEYIEQRIASGRYIDIGVTLRTVVQDSGILGRELLPGKPLLRVLRERTYGGIVDRKRGEIVARTRAPVVWYCSEEQERVVLHDDELPLALLVYGSEGAGKTTALAMWHYFRWLEHLGEGREAGQTAPTRDRLTAIRDEMFKLYPSTWYRHYKSKDIVVLCDGVGKRATKIRFRSTKRQSKEQGEAIQTYTWSWAGRDEIQDQIEAHGGIESRGRGARGGRYKQLGTATAKDSTDWRNFRDQLTAVNDNGKQDWLRLTLLGPNSPFVHPIFWETKKRTMSKRDYQRRVLAQDVPPELAVYYAWDREQNLVRLPQIATDVTAAVLEGYSSYVRPGARFAMLAGHDPGSIYNTTTLWRLMIFPAPRPRGTPIDKFLSPVPTWVCVGEFVTEQTTQREHARRLRKYIQDMWGFERDDDTSKVAIFCDPHGKGNGQSDYQAVYMAFQKERLDVFSPALDQTGRIHRPARVEMLNRLMSSYDGCVRLVVACNDNKQPVAPVLVESLESLEKRPGDDDPEGSQKKDEKDRTHAPVSAGYALWVFEQEAYTDRTVERAIEAARRMA
jgi:hypothetical protein